MKDRVGSFLLKFTMSGYMPRSIRVVVLATIGLLIAATALGAIEQVTAFTAEDGLHQIACVPYDSCCPGVMWFS